MAYPPPLVVGGMMGMPMGGPPMAGRDPHVSPQYMQPTKVIHLRNLPFDVTLEEIREFCAPWGTIVAMKDKVGGNRNQAFVEFAALEQAMAIVSHYQTAPEPAKFRGRPSWLSYSGRDRLTNVAPSSDSPTPVLQVTVNNVQADLAQAVNLELLHKMFGSHGFVKKMVTYPRPEGGVLAWVQFPDAQTAATVRSTLQGQPIPRHLINDHPNPPTLDMAFAAQPDLNIRNQSHSTRDFTNAALPWGEADLGMIQAMLPASGGTDGPSNVLSVSFDRMTYPVTLDGIHTIFSTYGFVQKIHIFERDARTVALVQYADVPTADAARAALEGHAMYDGGHNVMHVVYSKHRNLTIKPGSDRSKDYTMGAVPNPVPPPAAAASRPGAGMAGRPGPPPPGRVMPPRHGMGGAGMPYGGGAPQSYGGLQPRHDPNFQVTGEDYVRQHERVLEQYGGRTSGKGAPAPYAASGGYSGYSAPAAPAYPPPAAPPPAAGGYGGAYPPQAPPPYYSPGAPPAQPPPAYYPPSAPPQGGAPGYGGPPAPSYGGTPAPGGYGGYGYGGAPPGGPPPPAYGGQPPPAGGYQGYGY